MPGLVDDTYEYDLRVTVSHGVVDAVERTPHLSCYKTLLMPYLAEGGSGRLTHISSKGSVITLDCLEEQIEIAINAQVENVLILPHGFESHRGLAGLIRVDLLEPSEQVHYQLIKRR